MSIYSIVQQSDDALANQWMIAIPTFPGIIDPVGTNFRVTNVTIPDRSVGTYTVDYKTQKFTKPSGKDTTPNEFSFTFRVDKYWNVYKGFSNWHKQLIDPVTGFQAPDFANGTSLLRVPITVLTVDSQNVPTSTGWIFDGCFPSTVPGMEFSMESGDPITVAITMQFITFNPLS